MRGEARTIRTLHFAAKQFGREIEVVDHQVEHDADVFAAAFRRGRAHAHSFNALGTLARGEQAHRFEHQTLLVADRENEVTLERHLGERRASAPVSARGFSTSACLPASSALRVSVAWLEAGVAITSASHAAAIASNEENTSPLPTLATTLPAASALRSNTPTNSEWKLEAEFLGVVTAEHTRADDANPDLALVAADDGGRSGRGFGTLH